MPFDEKTTELMREVFAGCRCVACGSPAGRYVRYNYYCFACFDAEARAKRPLTPAPTATDTRRRCSKLASLEEERL